MTQDDVELNVKLISYSDVITPITTFIADENESIRQEKLEYLANETNSTTDDLLLPPSKASRNSIVVLNAIYEKMTEKKNQNSKADIAIAAVLQRFVEMNNNTNVDENATSKEIALAVEEQTILNLQAKGLLKRLDAERIQDLKSKKPQKPSQEDEDEVEAIEDSNSSSSTGNASNAGNANGMSNAASKAGNANGVSNAANAGKANKADNAKNTGSSD